MSKEVSNACATNVANIQMSENTKTLLLCRAQLSDIYNTVGDIMYKSYRADPPDSFQDAHHKFGSEIVNIMSKLIERTSLLSDYKEM